MPSQAEEVVKLVKETTIKVAAFYSALKSAVRPSHSTVWFSANGVNDDFTKVAVISDDHATVDYLSEKGFAAGHLDSKLADDPIWVYIKRANTTVADVSRPILKIMNLAPNSWNQLLGSAGTSPLVSMLTSGLLGGGLGYLGGTMAEQLVPESYLERGKLRKNTALLGALAGAAGPAYLGSVGMRMGDDDTKNPWKAWLEPNVMFSNQKEAIAKAYKAISELSQDPSAEDGVKKAFGYDSGDAGLFNVTAIPVDAFNRVVMQDPYATTGLQTATVGLTEAANQAKGNTGMISPFDIARIGLGMGAGLSQAYLGGKVLGALAGLTPNAQQKLQQVGMFAGALKAVVPGLFGR